MLKRDHYFFMFSRIGFCVGLKIFYFLFFRPMGLLDLVYYRRNPKFFFSTLLSHTPEVSNTKLVLYYSQYQDIHTHSTILIKKMKEFDFLLKYF
jgi:hypothetical protein